MSHYNATYEKLSISSPRSDLTIQVFHVAKHTVQVTYQSLGKQAAGPCNLRLNPDWFITTAEAPRILAPEELTIFGADHLLYSSLLNPLGERKLLLSLREDQNGCIATEHIPDKATDVPELGYMLVLPSCSSSVGAMIPVHHR